MKSSAHTFTKIIKELLLKKHTTDTKVLAHRPTKAELEKKWRLERVKLE